MIKTLEAWDQSLFKVLNGLHNEFFDFLMPWISNKYVWVPLYALLLYGMVKYTDYKWWQIILGTVLLITISDQLASGLLKPWVGRLRPCYEPSLEGTVHLLKYCGGQFGFASSHSSNSFATAIFSFYLLGDKFPMTRWLIAWAALVAYSRIYLGVHYPGDVIAGAFIGWLAAFIVHWILSKLNSNKTSLSHG